MASHRQSAQFHGGRRSAPDASRHASQNALVLSCRASSPLCLAVLVAHAWVGPGCDLRNCYALLLVPFAGRACRHARRTLPPLTFDLFRERGYYPVDPNKEEEAEGSSDNFRRYVMNREASALTARARLRCVFPVPGGPEKHDIRGALHKGEIGQFPQQPFGKARLKGKVEGLQRFDNGQTGGGHASFCGTTITPLQLSRNGALEELLIGPLLLPRRLKERRQGLLQLG